MEEFYQSNEVVLMEINSSWHCCQLVAMCNFIPHSHPNRTAMRKLKNKQMQILTGTIAQIESTEKRKTVKLENGKNNLWVDFRSNLLLKLLNTFQIGDVVQIAASSKASKSKGLTSITAKAIKKL